MSFNSELEKNNFTTNIVVKIGDEYFSQRPVDSGLVVPPENNIIDDPQINGTNLDIRQVNTPVGGFTFKLKDDTQGDQYITKKIMLDPNNFLEKTVEAFLGFNTGSFDFSEYKKIANTKIQSVTKIANGYSIRSKEVVSLITNPSYNIGTKLTTDILSVSLSLDVEEIEGFPTQGLVKVGNEFIRYNGITNSTLENLTRSEVGSTASAHESGEDIYLVTELIDQNPIDMMLQLLLSKNGDGTNHTTYDVYANGLGLSEEEINIDQFELIRDNFFTGELFRLYLYNQNNTLKFIEKELLKATGCRMFSDDGRVSIAILDQVDPSGSVPEINENVIVGTPTWTLGSNKIVNKIIIRYDFLESTGRYNKEVTFTDDDSITTFGEKPPLRLNFKGVLDSLDGGLIVQNRGQRYLTRLATPRGNISVRTLFNPANVGIGSKILLNHRFLPKQGAGLGIYDQLEVMSKSMNLKDAVLTFKLEYTSFTGIRVPFIAPSPNIVNIISQSSFEVPDGSCYSVGYGLRLWDKETKAYYPDDTRFITSVNGNIITVNEDFDTILTTNITVKMAEYNKQSTEQRNRYASVGFNSGFFEDDTKSYQIIF